MKLNLNIHKTVFIYSLFALLIGVFLPVGNAQASDGSKEKKIDIATKPAGYLFKIDNMKPGDWADRTLTVLNKENQDFNYTVKAHRKSGSEMLYNQLLLKVKDSSGILYDGKLSSFKGFDPRPLASFDEEDLTFTVKFPFESGNEFQGLATKVLFDFVVEDTGDTPTVGNNSLNQSSIGAIITGGGDSLLPQTANPAPYFFSLAGALFVLAGLTILAVRWRPFKK